MPHQALHSVGDNSYAAVTQIYEKTIAGLFLKRLREATNDILCLSLTLRAFGSIGRPAEETVVRVLDFVRWTEGELIKLPALFPTGDGPSEAPSSRKARRGRTSQSEAPPADRLIRLPEVLALAGVLSGHALAARQRSAVSSAYAPESSRHCLGSQRHRQVAERAVVARDSSVCQALKAKGLRTAAVVAAHSCPTLHLCPLES